MARIIKPGRIIFTPNGIVIADFEVDKHLDESVKIGLKEVFCYPGAQIFVSDKDWEEMTPEEQEGKPL